MDELAEFDRLVSLVYEVPLAPERLPAVLEQITGWLGVGNCHLIGWNNQTHESTLNIMIGVAQEVGLDYTAHYADVDPRRKFVLDHYAPGQLLACQEHFDARFVSRSEFYQDYLRAIGLRYLLATTLLDDPSRLVQIAFHHYVGHAPFSAHEIQMTERLIPHLQRAIALLLQSNALQQSMDIAAAGLDASPLALIAVDVCGRPVFCNRQAEALLRDGTVLRLCNGVLRARVAEQDSALAHAVAATARRGTSGNLTLSTSPGHARPARFSLTTIPAPEPERYALQSRAVALCLIAPLGTRRQATARQLMQLFGLTPAEARLLRALTQGTTLDDYASECDLRVTTVKTQLKSLFAKTGTCRQAALVRLIMDIPAVRA